MKRIRLTVAVVVGLLAPGCAEDGASVAQGGAGGSQLGAGGAGGGLTGTGGAPGAAGAIGSDFTRADWSICADWPPCPPEIVAPSTSTFRVLSVTCRATAEGAHVACGGCVNRFTCEQFVGRCIAQNWAWRRTSDGDVGASVSLSFMPKSTCVADEFTASDGTPLGPVLGTTICTGDNSSKTNAGTVCQD